MPFITLSEALAAGVYQIVTSPTPNPPDPNPPDPQPPNPGAYPDPSWPPDTYEFTLASMTWDFNVNTAPQTGMIGDPGVDLLAYLGGDTNRYNQLINQSSGFNPTRSSAMGLYEGMAQAAVMAATGLSAQDMSVLYPVMQHYNLIKP